MPNPQKTTEASQALTAQELRKFLYDTAFRQIGGRTIFQRSNYEAIAIEIEFGLGITKHDLTEKQQAGIKDHVNKISLFMGGMKPLSTLTEAHSGWGTKFLDVVERRLKAHFGTNHVNENFVNGTLETIAETLGVKLHRAASAAKTPLNDDKLDGEKTASGGKPAASDKGKTAPESGLGETTVKSREVALSEMHMLETVLFQPQRGRPPVFENKDELASVMALQSFPKDGGEPPLAELKTRTDKEKERVYRYFSGVSLSDATLDNIHAATVLQLADRDDVREATLKAFTRKHAEQAAAKFDPNAKPPAGVLAEDTTGGAVVEKNGTLPAAPPAAATNAAAPASAPVASDPAGSASVGSAPGIASAAPVPVASAAGADTAVVSTNTAASGTAPVAPVVTVRPLFKVTPQTIKYVLIETAYPEIGAKPFENVDRMSRLMPQVCDTNTASDAYGKMLKDFFDGEKALPVEEANHVFKIIAETTRARLANVPDLRDQLLANIGAAPGDKVQFAELITNPSGDGIALNAVPVPAAKAAGSTPGSKPSSVPAPAAPAASSGSVPAAAPTATVANPPADPASSASVAGADPVAGSANAAAATLAAGVDTVAVAANAAVARPLPSVTPQMVSKALIETEYPEIGRKPFESAEQLSKLIPQVCNIRMTNDASMQLVRGFFGKQEPISLDPPRFPYKIIVETTRARLANVPALRDKLLADIGAAPGDKVQFPDVITRPSSKLDIALEAKPVPPAPGAATAAAPSSSASSENTGALTPNTIKTLLIGPEKPFKTISDLVRAMDESCLDCANSNSMYVGLNRFFKSDEKALGGLFHQRVIEATRGRLKGYPALRDNLLSQIGGKAGSDIEYPDIVKLGAFEASSAASAATGGSPAASAGSAPASPAAAASLSASAPSSQSVASSEVAATASAAASPAIEPTISASTSTSSSGGAAAAVESGSATPAAVPVVVVSTGPASASPVTGGIAADAASAVAAGTPIAAPVVSEPVVPTSAPSAAGNVAVDATPTPSPVVATTIVTSVTQGGVAASQPEEARAPAIFVAATAAEVKAEPTGVRVFELPEILQKASTMLRAFDIPEDRVAALLSSKQERERLTQAMAALPQISQREEDLRAAQSVFDDEKIVALPKLVAEPGSKAALSLAINSLSVSPTSETKQNVNGLLTGVFKVPEAEVSALEAPHVQKALTRFIRASEAMTEKIKPEDADFARSIMGSPQRRTVVDFTFYMLDRMMPG